VSPVNASFCKSIWSIELRLASNVESLCQAFTVCQRTWLADCETTALHIPEDGAQFLERLFDIKGLGTKNAHSTQEFRATLAKQPNRPTAALPVGSYGKRAMRTIGKPLSTSAHADKPVPASLFRTSLREWQAKYKAERLNQSSGAAKERDQAIR
jgi:hypothetical protein